MQKDDFYPFGLSFNSYMRPGEVDQKYRFNQGAGGKTFRTERVEDFGLNVDMAKFRVYDYSLGRFWQSDPKSDVGGQESLTPYQYSFQPDKVQ